MTSREKIINAAILAFSKKGKHGAKIDSIAVGAHINKAMIYYLFRSKDKLYDEVVAYALYEACKDAYNSHMQDLKEGKGSVECLINLIQGLFHSFADNTNYAKIIIDAINTDEESLHYAFARFKERCGEDAMTLTSNLVRKGIDEGVFRDIDPEQVFISINGMAMVYSFTRAYMSVLKISITDEPEFIEKRLRSVTDLILNGILPRKS